MRFTAVNEAVLLVLLKRNSKKKADPEIEAVRVMVDPEVQWNNLRSLSLSLYCLY